MNVGWNTAVSQIVCASVYCPAILFDAALPYKETLAFQGAFMLYAD